MWLPLLPLSGLEPTEFGKRRPSLGSSSQGEVASARRSVMTASRREILLQGCAIGAGVIAANVPGIVALAQAGPFLRRSLHGMADNDPILEAWRDGVRLLKARPASNPVSWANFAAIHGDANS